MGEVSDTVLNEMLPLAPHMQVVSERGTTACVRVPLAWERCTHPPFVCISRLGGGAYGKVKAISSRQCVKTFKNPGWFLHEAIINDVVTLGRLMRPEAISDAIVTMDFACMTCRAIVYPRFSCSAEDYEHWRGFDGSVLAEKFAGLADAVAFLNDTCGVFHADISTSNIFLRLGADLRTVEKMVLGDLGVGTLHTGNRCTDISVLSPSGDVLYEMFGGRDPLYVCKDAFKPANILYRCYCIMITPVNEAQDTLEQRNLPPVGRLNARAVDLASLGYSLIEIMERSLDLMKRDPTTCFFESVKYRRPHPLYFLCFMAPKVAMLDQLSRLWDCQMSLGMTRSGYCDYISLSSAHRLMFKSWCRTVEREYTSHLFGEQAHSLRSPGLRRLLQSLLVNDRFGLSGG